MVEVNPPTIYPAKNFSIFLAGSIEQGKAIEWQKQIVEELYHHSGTIYNPRRSDYDVTQKQDINNEYFFKQVSWEMKYIRESTFLIFYFQKDTLSPITIGELYYCAASGKKCIVCCEEGFWRKGNIDIVCYEHNIPQVSSLQELVQRIKLEIYKEL